MGRKFLCVLCKRSAQSKVTGSLLTKDGITAHQFCLLYSSGIFCQDSPGSDDLFGFSVEDVEKEVGRGLKLKCDHCRKGGATTGCEVKRCKKSYHYPCAIEIGAKAIEDETHGKYGIYCPRHYEKKNNGTFQTSSASSSEARPSKAQYLVCEKKVSACNVCPASSCGTANKHAPFSQKKNNGGFAVAGPSLVISDSNSSRSATSRSAKRRLILDDQQEESPSKRKPGTWNRIISDDSRSSGDRERDANMEIFAPIEFDLEETSNSALEQQVDEPQDKRKVTVSPAAPTSGGHHSDQSGGGNKDAAEILILSEDESETLLPPVDAQVDSRPPEFSQSEQATQTLQPKLAVVKSERRAAVEIYDDWPSAPSPIVDIPAVKSLSPYSSLQRYDESPSPPISEASPASPPSGPEPDMKPCSFWERCNAAGCTQTIFTDFIEQMKDVGRRIQSHQASEEDCDLALSVMKASGKLVAIVAKQQEELQKKWMELQKATEAMMEVVSALEKRAR